MQTKLCTKCNENKSLEDFAINHTSKDGRNWKCKRCHSFYKKMLYYNLSEEEFFLLLEVQNNKCAICLDLIDENSAHVDHEHSNGHHRGLLCMHCNMGLGKFKDDPVILRKAADYIERHKK